MCLACLIMLDGVVGVNIDILVVRYEIPRCSKIE